MASCEICGVEVAPGDVVYLHTDNEAFPFCGKEHLQKGIENRMATNRAKAARAASKEAVQSPSPSVSPAKTPRKRQARKR